MFEGMIKQTVLLLAKQDYWAFICRRKCGKKIIGHDVNKRFIILRCGRREKILPQNNDYVVFYDAVTWPECTKLDAFKGPAKWRGIRLTRVQCLQGGRGLMELKFTETFTFFWVVNIFDIASLSGKFWGNNSWIMSKEYISRFRKIRFRNIRAFVVSTKSDFNVRKEANTVTCTWKDTICFFWILTTTQEEN